MIPYPSSALSMLSDRLMNHLLGDLQSAYYMSDGMLVGVLMNALAEELESGVEKRIQDIREMQTILADAGQKLDSDELPADIDKLSQATPADMTLASVNDLHDSITKALIDLHATVEAQTGEGAAAEVNKEIWGYLQRYTERHQIMMAG